MRTFRTDETGLKWEHEGHGLLGAFRSASIPRGEMGTVSRTVPNKLDEMNWKELVFQRYRVNE